MLPSASLIFFVAIKLCFTFWAASSNFSDTALISSLLTPASNFSSKCHEVRFVDVSNVSIIDIASNKFIRIKHKAGKIDLSSVMFKNKDMFNECYAAILAVKQSA